MTGDDHAQRRHRRPVRPLQGGQTRRAARSPTGSASGRRPTSSRARRSPAPRRFEADGFEIALHLGTGCEQLHAARRSRANWSDQLADFTRGVPDLDAPATNRTHCIAWSDWASEPIVELANGIRLDTNYYYWPADLVHDRPGMFTGSGMPMRFADLDGSLIDVYQAATQMTDESGIDYAAHIKALLDGALGPRATTASSRPTCTRTAPSTRARTRSWPRRRQRGVPVVSARQMLEWLDGRNGSSFDGLAFSGNRLRFSVQRGGAGARGLRGDAAGRRAHRRALRRSPAGARSHDRPRARSRASSTRSSTLTPATTKRRTARRRPVPGRPTRRSPSSR